MRRRDTPQRRPVPYIGPEPLAGHHQAFDGQCRQRRPDRRPAHPVVTLELALSGELAPRPPSALLNPCPQHIRQLQRKRAIRSRVKALRHHPPARARSACRASTTGQRTAQTTRKPSLACHPATGQRKSAEPIAVRSRSFALPNLAVFDSSGAAARRRVRRSPRPRSGLGGPARRARAVPWAGRGRQAYSYGRGGVARYRHARVQLSGPAAPWGSAPTRRGITRPM